MLTRLLCSSSPKVGDASKVTRIRLNPSESDQAMCRATVQSLQQSVAKDGYHDHQTQKRQTDEVGIVIMNFADIELCDNELCRY